MPRFSIAILRPEQDPRTLVTLYAKDVVHAMNDWATTFVEMAKHTMGLTERAKGLFELRCGCLYTMEFLNPPAVHWKLGSPCTEHIDRFTRPPNTPGPRGHADLLELYHAESERWGWADEVVFLVQREPTLKEV